MAQLTAEQSEIYAWTFDTAVGDKKKQQQLRIAVTVMVYLC